MIERRSDVRRRTRDDTLARRRSVSPGQQPTGQGALNDPLTFVEVLAPAVTVPVNENVPLISVDEEEVIVSVPLELV